MLMLLMVGSEPQRLMVPYGSISEPLLTVEVRKSEMIIPTWRLETSSSQLVPARHPFVIHHDMSRWAHSRLKQLQMQDIEDLANFAAGLAWFGIEMRQAN